MGLRRPRLLSARVERWQSGNSARKMKMRPSTCRIHTSYICHVHDIMLMYHPGSPRSSRYFSALLCGNTDPLRSMPQLSLHPPQPPRRRPTSLRPRRTRARTWTGLSRTPTRFRHTHTHTLLRVLLHPLSCRLVMPLPIVHILCGNALHQRVTRIGISQQRSD